MKEILERAIDAVGRRFGRETVAQFVRFSLVGAFNTGLDFSVYLFLTRTFAFWGEHPVRASATSFCVGVISSFILNNFWTFGFSGQRWHARIVKFATVATVGLSLNSLIMYALVHAGTYDVLAKATATVTVVLWNFTMQKTWTFRERPEPVLEEVEDEE